MSGGGGGSGGYSGGYSGGSARESTTEERVRNEIDISIENTKKAEFEAEVNDRLKGLLTSYNERDTELINERLEEIRSLLSDYLESSINIRRGGSWRKHTYVDGLSDVDCLFILNSTKFAGESPQQLLDELTQLLKNQLGKKATVERGDLSVRITYEDGPELQILPALKNEKGIRIPSGDSEGWSRIVNPENFAERLTEINQNLNGNIIPVIKLAKGTINDVGLTHKVKGYHTEALAIEIFQNYSGERTKKAMLEYFFLKAAELVRKPIKEVSGQSQYVDDYLGVAGSVEREAMSREFKVIYDKMKNANENRSSDDWFRAIGI